ncbi:hypothetical protein BOTBODRAFT_175287 [Botryobasidium botryosum FD-172 SS1]|uniref:Uncharacterized protein n=1 Tax=Botryobasidium botryosum (strain FD-172 SS1) TaxID=930990 RepID=A0A067MPU5_BOTB1|nr:hypothetical protein BOTBODRAFT_175287 [Botryobasidium botryosum FD-172 SS1]
MSAKFIDVFVVPAVVADIPFEDRLVPVRNAKERGARVVSTRPVDPFTNGYPTSTCPARRVCPPAPKAKRTLPVSAVARASLRAAEPVHHRTDPRRRTVPPAPRVKRVMRFAREAAAATLLCASLVDDDDDLAGELPYPRYAFESVQGSAPPSPLSGRARFGGNPGMTQGRARGTSFLTTWTNHRSGSSLGQAQSGAFRVWEGRRWAEVSLTAAARTKLDVGLRCEPLFEVSAAALADPRLASRGGF